MARKQKVVLRFYATILTLDLIFLPLWFEMQLTTPTFNAYGVSFPGCPCIIIGFNDSCAFGFTNAARDVRDYYEIKFQDETMKEYWFNGAWKQSDFRYEHINIKGEPEIIDTIAYTVFGPVMYRQKILGYAPPWGWWLLCSKMEGPRSKQ